MNSIRQERAPSGAVGEPASKKKCPARGRKHRRNGAAKHKATAEKGLNSVNPAFETHDDCAGDGRR